jgi:very-short-patch-repair endonuclease
MSIKCWICGEPATRTKPILEHGWWTEPPISEKRRCYCDKCYKELEQTESEERKTYVRLRKREMFRKAVKILESQNTNMYQYKEAIEVVHDFLEDNIDKADSSYEILTAIVLVQNRIYSKMQYKVGKYQVDFLLPDYMVVLEIDGERHKHRKEYDSQRDKFIKKQLGVHWEIIRLSTDDLDKNAKKIPKAIDKVLEYRETNHINWRKL